MTGMPGLWTIGHSTHPVARFIGLLKDHGVAGVADVRTMPASRFNPQYNRAAFSAALAESGLQYRFLGAELGGKRADRPDYAAALGDASFQAGLDRLQAECAARPMAIVCAERDPLDCHRFHFVCRALRRSPLPIVHILADGTSETQAQAEARLLRCVEGEPLPLLTGASAPREADIERSYDVRWRRMTEPKRR